MSQEPRSVQVSSAFSWLRQHWRPLAKLAIVMASPGGYVFHSDHSLPPQVSLARYSRVLELVRQHGVYGRGSESGLDSPP